MSLENDGPDLQGWNMWYTIWYDQNDRRCLKADRKLALIYRTEPVTENNKKAKKTKTP